MKCGRWTGGGKHRSVLVCDSLVNRKIYKAYQKKIPKGGVIAPVILFDVYFLY